MHGVKEQIWLDACVDRAVTAGRRDPGAEGRQVSGGKLAVVLGALGSVWPSCLPWDTTKTHSNVVLCVCVRGSTKGLGALPASLPRVSESVVGTDEKSVYGRDAQPVGLHEHPSWRTIRVGEGESLSRELPSPAVSTG